MREDSKEQIVRDYLLGRGLEADSLRVEEGLFTDGESYRELVILEDELIDEYLNDELSQPERESFESHFLRTPERQRKLSFGRTFNQYLDRTAASEPLNASTPPELLTEEPKLINPPAKENILTFLPFKNSLISQSLAAAVLVIAVGVSWVVLKNWRERNSTQPGSELVATLTPGLTRDSGKLPRLSIPPGTTAVQLRLLLRSAADQTYRTELVTSEHASVLVSDNLKPQNQNAEAFILMSIPARILKRDDYQVRLSIRHPDGSYEELPSYQFRVIG